MSWITRLAYDMNDMRFIPKKKVTAMTMRPMFPYFFQILLDRISCFS